MDEVDVDRLRAHADRRPVAIPDIQGEISGALGNLDEMFARAGPDAEYPEDVTVITEAARDAVGRLSIAVYKAEEGPLAQPWHRTATTSLCPWRGRTWKRPT